MKEFCLYCVGEDVEDKGKGREGAREEKGGERETKGGKREGAKKRILIRMGEKKRKTIIIMRIKGKGRNNKGEIMRN